VFLQRHFEEMDNQAAMPTAALWQGSAMDNGLLYCIGVKAASRER
jgi:hypothetical protein